MRHFRVACWVVALAVGTAGAALAQVRPAPGGARVPADKMELGVRCIAGFTLKQTGSSYTCTSAPVRCDPRMPLSDTAQLQGDRFVYGCSKRPG